MTQLKDNMSKQDRIALAKAELQLLLMKHIEEFEASDKLTPELTSEDVITVLADLIKWQMS